MVQWRSVGKAYVQRRTFNFWNWTELKPIDDDRFSLPEIQESSNSLRHFQVHHTHKVSSTIAPLPQCVLFEAMLTYMITVYHAPVDHDCAGGDTHQLVESSVGVRPSKWDRLVSCYSYHRRYWPGVLWFPLLILLRCTVERGYVGNRGSLLRVSHGQIGQWRSHGGILFGEPKTHEGNTNTQNL